MDQQFHFRQVKKSDPERSYKHNRMTVSSRWLARGFDLAKFG